jgi:hypothetical protein
MVGWTPDVANQGLWHKSGTRHSPVKRIRENRGAVIDIKGHKDDEAEQGSTDDPRLASLAHDLVRAIALRATIDQAPRSKNLLLGCRDVEFDEFCGCSSRTFFSIGSEIA